MSEHDDLDPQLRDLAGWLDDATEAVTLAEAQASGGARPPVGALSTTSDDDADVLLLAPHDRGETHSPRRAMSPRVLAVAAVVVAIALVGGVLALTGGGDEPTGVATDLTTVPSGSWGDLTQGWERIDAAFPVGTQVVAVGSNGDRVIAAAIDTSSCDVHEDPQCVPERLDAWTSTAGSEWTKAGTIADDLAGGWAVADPESIVWNGERWLLAGKVVDMPVIWSSPDGSSWDQTPVEPIRNGATVTGLVVIDGGVVAVGLPRNPGPEGYTFSAPVVWRSLVGPDLAWDAETAVTSSLPVSAGPNFDHVDGVTSIGSTVIAHGTAIAAADVEPDDPDGVVPTEDGARPAIWVSLDSGQTWIQSVLSEQPGRVIHAVATDDAFVLTGTLDGRAASWRLDLSGGVQGVTSSVSTPSPTTAIETTDDVPAGVLEPLPWPIAAGPAGLVAFDAELGQFIVGSDGLDWAAVQQPDLVPAGANVHHITAEGDGFVAFGHVGDVPTVWRWQPSAPIPPTTTDATPDTTSGTPDTIAPPTTEAPPTTAAPPTTEPTVHDGQVCIESLTSTLQDAYLAGDGSDPARGAAVVLVDGGTTDRWQQDGVCVTTVVLSQDALELSVMDETLSAELEASALALVPEGSLIIHRQALSSDPPVYEDGCLVSIESSLQNGLSERHLDDAELRAMSRMIESDMAADWDAAGVCVSGWGTDIDGFMLSVIDATLAPELEEQTVAAVAPDHVSIVRIDEPQTITPWPAEE